jgi:hypothetical protein
MSDTTEAAGANNDGWYFTESGQRKGPIATANLLELLRAEKISGDTPVWRKGFADWQPLRATDLGGHLPDSPPPVAPTHVNNGLVWAIAVAPIPYGIFGGFIQALEMDTPVEPHPLLQLTSVFVPVAINAALCLADERQIKRAGYADRWLTLFGVLLAPVYLFLRAKRLRQTPSYGYAWVVSFIITLVLSIPH